MPWAPDYTDTTTLAAHLRIPDQLDAVDLASSIAAASRAIDQACNRQFGQVDVVELRYYPARWDRVRSQYLVVLDDLPTITGLVVEQAGTAVTGYELGPRNALVKGQVYTELWVDSLPDSTSDVEVTASWGWSAVPDAVVAACKMQASRLFARRDAPFGVAGSPDVGSEMRLLAKIDPDVEVTLRGFRRWWGAL